jgi:phospholipase/lecithinase/hemolysin
MMRGELFTNRMKLEKQVKGLKEQHKTVKANELVLIVMGTNDVIAAVDKHERFESRVMNEEKKVLSKAINRLILQLTNLRKIQATKIIVANVPNFSVAPKYKEAYLKRDAASVLVKYFNKTLKTRLQI